MAWQLSWDSQIWQPESAFNWALSWIWKLNYIRYKNSLWSHFFFSFPVSQHERVCRAKYSWVRRSKSLRNTATQQPVNSLFPASKQEKKLWISWECSLNEMAAKWNEIQFKAILQHNWASREEKKNCPLTLYTVLGVFSLRNLATFCGFYFSQRMHPLYSQWNELM